jgi:putative membrane protein
MATLDDVRQLTRPDRALVTVYLVRAIGGAFGVLMALGFIALRAFGWDGIEAGIKRAGEAGVPVVALGALVFLVCYAIAALALYVRFLTLRYEFAEDGFTRRWGLFFRRESFLAYGKIQDAQVSQGAVERFFGIGTVAIQTAAGTRGFEESIEGLREFNLVRDFLYGHMRGAHAKPSAPSVPAEIGLVNEIRDEMRALRLAVEARR